MSSWKIRGCPRCKGDLFLDMDGRERFGHCLQCGYMSCQPDKERPVRPQARHGESVADRTAASASVC